MQGVFVQGGLCVGGMHPTGMHSCFNLANVSPFCGATDTTVLDFW